MASTLDIKLEALLFASDRPLGIRKLTDFLKVKPAEVEVALTALSERLAARESGVRIVRSGSEVQMMTSPELSKLVRDFLKDELTGELTKPQLETLTVIAYRQPVTKPELEQIRGVNCSLILRNLMMRGLIEIEESKEKFGPSYRVTHNFMRFLGLGDVRELPDYEKLHTDAHIEAVLGETKPETPPQSV